ncbi:hypothetical protein PanWU01x14_210800 [Parasponia andersonii]|uniref:Uncharacterized protein n=1 Tax=Parasponia andersonii TaxID=3476 RepID=A0A2P5BTX0_PARAD|nr:hypothetical protein PanWU01x14_210800 [Parasponia andersonii]
MLESMTLWWEFNTRNDRRLLLFTLKIQKFVWRGNILRPPLTENLAALRSSTNNFLPLLHL